MLEVEVEDCLECQFWDFKTEFKELELELIQTHMAQKPLPRVKCARVALRASQNAKEDGLGKTAIKEAKHDKSSFGRLNWTRFCRVMMVCSSTSSNSNRPSTRVATWATKRLWAEGRTLTFEVQICVIKLAAYAGDCAISECLAFSIVSRDEGFKVD
jgi:hypothetical protein